MQCMLRPGPVYSFLWQMWHLKCFAFWCWIKIFSSSNSRLQYLQDWHELKIIIHRRPWGSLCSWTWSNLLIGVALWGTLTSTRAWTASSFSGPFFSPGLGLIPTATPRFSFNYVESFSTKIGESQIWNGNGLYSWLQYSAVSIFRDR